MRASDPRTPVEGYCRTCGRPRRLRFGGYATAVGHENTVRPRAFYRSCPECALTLLVLGWPLDGHVSDGEGLVGVVLGEWLRTSGAEISERIDRDELRGMLSETLWRRYLRWMPGGISFTSDATFVLRQRLKSWAREQLGGVQRRNGRGGLYTVQPKSHAVSDSYDEIVRIGRDDEARLDRLERAHAAGQAYVSGGLGLDVVRLLGL